MLLRIEAHRKISITFNCPELFSDCGASFTLPTFTISSPGFPLRYPDNQDCSYHIQVASEKVSSLQWRHNGHDVVLNHQPHHRLLNRLFGCRSKKTSKLHVTGLCAVNSPGTGEFSAQMASNAEKASIWWRHHVVIHLLPLLVCALQ